MGDGVFPPDEVVPRLVPGPGSVTRRRAGDARILATAGYALILQVAHPTVGAGVREHSNFAADPWGRLLRTLDYTTTMAYGGPAAARQMGRRIHEMHKHISGRKPNGEPYFALEPEAFAWVHATLAMSIVVGSKRFAGGMTPAEVEGFYSEWRGIGRLIGVAADALPENWREFGAYFDRMVDERLEDNYVVHEVLRTLAKPIPPPLPLLREPAWRLTRLPIGRLGALATVGLLPARLRDRLGLRWSRGRDLELRALAAASRATGPLMPASLRCFGAAYLLWRHEALAPIVGARPRSVRVTRAQRA
jgi:uncharacterized protein (DUF2236 family)